MRNKALLVIDMQMDICRDLRRKDKVDRILKPLLDTIEIFTKTQQPIFYICFSLPPNDEQFKRFGDVYCVEGTPGAEIIPELLPLRGDVIKKKKHSAFFETDLDYRLRKAGVSEIYLTGLQTQICIMTTAADASFRGYKIVTIEDCVVSTHEENKKEALRWIQKYVGEVKPFGLIEKDFCHE